MNPSLAWLLLPLPILQGQVLVVDPAGGGDFLAVDPAIAAASNGDVVLLRPGSYAGQSVVLPPGKGVVLVADSATPIVLGPLTVGGVGSADAALLQGLVFVTSQGPPDRILSSSGPVWVERCRFQHQVQGVTGVGGVLVEDSASVVFTRTNMDPPVHLFATPPAFEARGSRVHVHATTILGLGDNIELGNATAARVHDASFAEFLGSTVSGGTGADGNFFHCDGYDGGIGLTLDSNGSARVLDSTIEGGAGGQPIGTCFSGLAGADVVTLSGATLAPSSGVARGFEVSSPVREGERVEATFCGLPGDLVWLAFSARPATGSAFPALDGELLIGSPQVLLLGTVSSTGTLKVVTAAPSLAPGTEAQVFHGQAIFRDGQTRRFVASSPSALVLLDSAL